MVVDTLYFKNDYNRCKRLLLVTAITAVLGSPDSSNICEQMCTVCRCGKTVVVKWLSIERTLRNYQGIIWLIKVGCRCRVSRLKKKRHLHSKQKIHRQSTQHVFFLYWTEYYSIARLDTHWKNTHPRIGFACLNKYACRCWWSGWKIPSHHLHHHQTRARPG